MLIRYEVFSVIAYAYNNIDINVSIEKVFAVFNLFCLRIKNEHRYL